MIRPLLQHDALVEDIRRAATSPDRLCLWWLGQSGFLAQASGRRVLFDPYLSDSLTRKYAATDKPHVRLTELVVSPERLAGIDAVTSSHNHTDHLDAETLLPLMQSNPEMQLVVPEANREFVCQRLGVPADRPLGLDAGESVTVRDVRFHAVPAAHNDLAKDASGRHLYLGYVVEIGPWRIYHSGDTLRYPGMEDWLKPWAVDVALLPINGNVPARRVAGNLDGREAAQLARDIGAKLAVPCHFEMFGFNTVTPDLFAASCRELGQPFQIPRCGERLERPQLTP